MVPTESPFIAHRKEILRQDRLQALTLHLYCAADWPLDLSRHLTNWDQRNFAIAIELMTQYWRNGENDSAFLDLGRELAEARLRES